MLNISLVMMMMVGPEFTEHLTGLMQVTIDNSLAKVMQTLAVQVKEVRKQQEEQQSKQKEHTETLSLHQNKKDEHTNQLETLKRELQAIREETKNETQLQRQERMSRLRFTGIPELPDEDITRTIKKIIMEDMQTPLSRDAIISAERIGSLSVRKNSQTKTKTPRSPDTDKFQSHSNLFGRGRTCTEQSLPWQEAEFL
jgi:uncharacterized coiled-coil DUF342 family protein